MAELIMQEEASTPSTPSSGKWKAYFKSDGLYILDDAGNVEGPLGAGGGAYGGFFGADGVMINGKISVTVASNNLTVAIKTLAGTDPSVSDPVYVRINDTIRSIISALSVTKNAGTNWCNAGGSELATKEVDYFVYLIWNTTPATDVVDIGFSRIPHGRVYNNFSGTSTNEKYLAYGNGSAPTSTDDVVNIGRFAATLSAGAGYTWTVPTFTSENLIQRPIYNTRWLDFAPQWSGSGSMTVTGVTVGRGKYQLFMENCEIDIVVSAFTIGGTPATIIYQTNPFSSAASNNPLISAASIQDSGGLIMGFNRSDATVTRCGYVKSTGANYAAGAGVLLNSKGSFTI